MTNRPGEFDLIFDPGNEAHAVRQDIVHQIVAALEVVFQIANWGNGDEIGLFYVATPERGSVRFPMWVGSIASSKGIAIAADVAQVTGVSIVGAFAAIHLIAAPDDAAKRPSSDAARWYVQRPDFGDGVIRVIEIASASGYRSIRIRTPEGLEIELTNPSPTFDLTPEQEAERAAVADAARRGTPQTGNGAEDARARDRAVAAAVRAYRYELAVKQFKEARKAAGHDISW